MPREFIVAIGLVKQAAATVHKKAGRLEDKKADAIIAAARELIDGKLGPGTRISLMSTGGSFEVAEVGVFTPKMQQVDGLSAGEVGYLIAGKKSI